MHFDLLIEHVIIQFNTRRGGRLTLSLTSLLKVTCRMLQKRLPLLTDVGCISNPESSLLLQTSGLKIKSLWLVKEQRV